MFIIAIKNPARGLWSSHCVGIPGRKFPPRRPGMDGSDDIIEQPDCCEASPLWGPAWHKINSLPTSGQLWQLKLRYIRHWSLARPALRRVVITQEGTQTHHPLRAGRLGGKNQEILQQHWNSAQNTVSLEMMLIFWAPDRPLLQTLADTSATGDEEGRVGEEKCINHCPSLHCPALDCTALHWSHLPPVCWCGAGGDIWPVLGEGTYWAWTGLATLFKAGMTRLIALPVLTRIVCTKLEF